MIHLRISTCATDEGDAPSFQVVANGEADIKRLAEVFNRALNCWPEAGHDLFYVCDKLVATCDTLGKTFQSKEST